MELTDSDSKNTDSELDEELESELYSVLHYNILSDEISPNLLLKYDIRINDQNEYFISLKRNVDNKKEAVEKNAETNHETSISEEQVVESDIVTISDRDDSDVILDEPSLDVTYVSSPSIVEISDSSSSDMDDHVLLNISGSSQIKPPIDDSEEESFPVKWKKVMSPKYWTINMKKYYNKPCERLKNFNYEKIKEEIKGTGGDWEINVADRFPSKQKLKRCTICRQTDHKMKNCPRKFLNCMMCGNPGHNDSHCPHRKCLNCGRRNNVFVAMCHRCEHERYQKCSECGQKGHSKYNCPDTWRRFHSTTSGELVVKEQIVNQKLFCCNCAQIGHLFEHCPKLYWSPYPPTSSTIKKTREIIPAARQGKKFRRFIEEDSISFDRSPPKVFKWNHNTSTPFNRASTSYKQSPRTPNNKKKMRYFHANTFNNNENFNNHSFNRNKKRSPKKQKNWKKKNSLIPNNSF